MIPQAYSILGKKYNIVILAGGNGTRMGTQSDYIPKALSQIGNGRAIDYIISKYLFVAHKYVIGTCRHADLLESYVKGRYSGLPVEFSREQELYGSGISTMFCLDHCDTSYSTIVVFCDLITISNNEIKDDSILVASNLTRGVVGSFRHFDTKNRGILGNFTFSRTDILKWITYKAFADGKMSEGKKLSDITEDIVGPYMLNYKMTFEHCDVVYEFGNDNDLEKVREEWERGALESSKG